MVVRVCQKQPLGTHNLLMNIIPFQQAFFLGKASQIAWGSQALGYLLPRLISIAFSDLVVILGH
jgi:hypothetical protein